MRILNTVSYTHLQYKTVEAAIAESENIKPKKASENLKNFSEQARLSRTLVEIDTDVPINFDFENMKADRPYSEEAYGMFKKLGFKSMLESCLLYTSRCV